MIALVVVGFIIASVGVLITPSAAILQDWRVGALGLGLTFVGCLMMGKGLS